MENWFADRCAGIHERTNVTKHFELLSSEAVGNPILPSEVRSSFWECSTLFMGAEHKINGFDGNEKLRIGSGLWQRGNQEVCVPCDMT
jgi:hypothetical protein